MSFRLVELTFDLHFISLQMLLVLTCRTEERSTAGITHGFTHGAKISHPTTLVRVVWGLSHLQDGPWFFFFAPPHNIEKKTYHNSDICKVVGPVLSLGPGLLCEVYSYLALPAS